MWIVLSLLCRAPEIEVPVDARVMRLSQLVRELGELGGTQLRVATDLANEVVGVASPKRPLREIMDGIAAAANGEWIQDGDAWLLRQTKAQAEADQKAETAYREQRIESFLRTVKVDQPFTEATAEALVAARNEYYKDNQPFAQYASLNSRSPATRFGTRVALAIGAPRLAEVSPSRTVVFSTQPNERQKPLAVSVLGQVYEDFVREQALYVDAYQPTIQKAKTGGGGEVYLPVSQGLQGIDVLIKPPTGATKMLVVATGTILGGVSMQILVADRSGKILMRTTSVVRPPSSEGVWDGLDKGRNPIEHTGWKAEFYRSSGHLSPEIQTNLLAPAEHEPHAIWFEGGIRTWSRISGKPVFLLVPDMSGPVSRPEPATPLEIATLAAFQLSTRLRCAIAEDSARVVIRPKEPMLSRRMRADRLALQAYLKSTANPMMPDVLKLLKRTDTDQLTFAFRQLDLAGRPLSHPLSMVPMLRIAALANQDLLPAGTLTFGEMNEAQRRAARHLIYEVRYWTSQMDTLMSEPTEAFPRDLPNTARLTVQSVSQEGARVEQYPDSWSTLRLDGSLEWLIYGPAVQDMKFRWGKFRHYTFTFDAHPLHRHVVHPSDIEALNAEVIPYSQLPVEFREALEKRIKEQRRTLGMDGD